MENYYTRRQRERRERSITECSKCGKKIDLVKKDGFDSNAGPVCKSCYINNANNLEEENE